MNETISESPEKVPLKLRLQRISLFILAGLSVFLIIWIAVSGMITDARHAEDMQMERAASAKTLDERSRSLLHTVAAALQPGTGEALRSGNDGLLRAHVQALAGKRDIRLVIVADQHGMVRASTDSRLTGSKLQSTYQLLTAGVEGITVDTTSKELYRVIGPLGGSADRIGTLIVECEFPAP